MATGLIPWIQLVLCSRCKHPYLFHVHVARLRSQRDLRRVTDNATDEISPLGEDYAGAWPSWSLSARVAKAIRLLEQNHTDMEEKGVSQEQLEIMQRSLERMKRRLDLLRNVKEKVQKGIWKIFLHAKRQYQSVYLLPSMSFPLCSHLCLRLTPLSCPSNDQGVHFLQ